MKKLIKVFAYYAILTVAGFNIYTAIEVSNDEVGLMMDDVEALAKEPENPIRYGTVGYSICWHSYQYLDSFGREIVRFDCVGGEMERNPIVECYLGDFYYLDFRTGKTYTLY